MTIVICNSRLLNSEILSKLSFPNIRNSASILPDFIFNDCVPSLAVVICENPIEAWEANISRINHFQRQFRNAFVIVIGILEDDAWLEFQCKVEFGNARLFLVETILEAVNLLDNIHDTMKNKSKFDLQAKILEEQKAQLLSSKAIKAMVCNLMSEMDIPENEAERIINHHRTLKKIVTECDKYMDPVTGQQWYSEESAKKLAALFTDTGGKMAAEDDDAMEEEEDSTFNQNEASNEASESK